MIELVELAAIRAEELAIPFLVSSEGSTALGPSIVAIEFRDAVTLASFRLSRLVGRELYRGRWRLEPTWGTAVDPADLSFFMCGVVAGELNRLLGAHLLATVRIVARTPRRPS